MSAALEPLAAWLLSQAGKRSVLTLMTASAGNIDCWRVTPEHDDQSFADVTSL